MSTMHAILAAINPHELAAAILIAYLLFIAVVILDICDAERSKNAKR